MNCCESEVRVQNEHALRFPIVNKPAPLLEYIKQISSSIGASHVLAVFEESDSVKVFFDDRRLVDSLVKSGIHVMGHHLRPDYVIPPGTKVILSNIDPVISNFDVMRLLALYGTIVSPVIRPSVSDDVELCHIGYGERYVYMVLNAPLPSKLEFKYGDQLCHIHIRVENDLLPFPSIKLDADENGTEETSSDLTNQNPSPELSSSDAVLVVDNSDIPVLVSVQSAASETNTDVQTECLQSEKSEKDQMNGYPTRKTRKEPIQHKGRFRRGGMRLKRKKLTATTKVANKIARNVKNKWGSRKIKNIRKRPGRPRVQAFVINTAISSSSSSGADSPTIPLLTDETAQENSDKAVFSKEVLETFLEEVKHSRTPLDCAKKYLGDDMSTQSVNNLIDQLISYNKSHNYTNLKLRVCRLIKILKEAYY